jgi:WbqC-like protein family
VILSTAYLPPSAWFASALHADGGSFLIEQYEHFQKGTIRNRCLIAGPNGVQTLSVPLKKGKNNQQPIRDVRIAYDEPWQRVHWRSIMAAYGSAPLFPYYADALEEHYIKQFDFLFDYNLSLINLLIKAFKQPLAYSFTTEYAGAITDFTHDTPPYPQVFEDRYGYRGGLSALDALMCSGKI